MSPSGPGPRLREQRRALGLSLEQVEERIRVRADFINAIEKGQIDRLPTVGYGVGYVRAYAQALGLDADHAVAEFKALCAKSGSSGRRGPNLPRLSPATRFRLPRGSVPALGVIAAVVMLGTWYGIQLDTQATVTAGQNAPISLEPNETVESAPIPDTVLTVRTTAPSWISIRDPRGQLIANRVFVTGESWQMDVGTAYTISVRDGGAVELMVGESSLGPIGREGEPVRDFALAPIR